VPSAAKSGSPRRSQAERRATTEEKVLEAATRLIATHGAQNLSLRDIGREAGYSRGIVNHHFGTRQALLNALTEHAQQTFALPPTDSTGLDLLAFTVEKYLDYLTERAPNGQAFLLLWADAVGSEPALQDVFKERDASFRQTLAHHVEQGMQEGSIRADADPQAVAVSVLGMLRGIGLQLLLAATVSSLDAIRDEAVKIIRNGLATEHARHQPPSAPR
jgi:AcrR family transcriptional regulator